MARFVNYRKILSRCSPHLLSLGGGVELRCSIFTTICSDLFDVLFSFVTRMWRTSLNPHVFFLRLIRFWSRVIIFTFIRHHFFHNLFTLIMVIKIIVNFAKTFSWTPLVGAGQSQASWLNCLELPLYLHDKAFFFPFPFAHSHCAFFQTWWFDSHTTQKLPEPCPKTSLPGIHRSSPGWRSCNPVWRRGGRWWWHRIDFMFTN